MREDVVRLSFDISVHEHALLKAACAEAIPHSATPPQHRKVWRDFSRYPIRRFFSE